jgi:hypothetical protein
MLTLLFYTVLLAAVVSAGPSSLWKRQTANVPKAVVVTGCTQPSTVALTFVRAFISFVLFRI